MRRTLFALAAMLAALATGFQAHAATLCTAGNPNTTTVAESTPTTAFTDNGDGTVTHHLTGLTWKKCAEGLSGEDCLTGSATTFTWADALIQAKNAAGDWRLPNKKELESIVEFCGYNPSINQTLFPNTPASSFWSGSSYVPFPAAAWVVYFNRGITGAGDESGDDYARLVRGGQSFDAFDAQSDTTPDPFTFTDVTGVPLSTVQTSDTITVGGITAPAAISIVGGEYELNSSGTWTSSAGTVANGDTVRVRHTSSGTNSTAVNTTLTIGGVSDTFTSTTLADTIPDSFTFTDLTGVPLSTVQTSDAITVSGIAAPAAITIVGGEYQMNGAGPWTSSPGTVANTNTVQVRHTSSATNSTAVNTTLTIGGVSDTFTSTTLDDTTPDPFTFTDVTGVPRSTVQTSNAITVSGITAPAAISIVGGEYEVNSSGTWSSSSPTTVANGDTVRVRHTSAATYSTAVNTTLTIGGVSDTLYLDHPRPGPHRGLEPGEPDLSPGSVHAPGLREGLEPGERDRPHLPPAGDPFRRCGHGW
jgi:hypothetical protein